MTRCTKVNLLNNKAFLIVSMISSPVGIIEIIQSILQVGGVVVHALDEPHPEHLVHLPGLGRVPRVAEVAQLETVRPLQKP